jgi:hypothetical protein
MKTNDVKRILFIVIILLLKVTAWGQSGNDDYPVMSAIINSELRGFQPASLAVMKNGIKAAEKTAQSSGIVNPLQSKKLNVRFQVYFLTENADRERLTIIDSISALHLIDYCQDKTDGGLLTDKFNLPFQTVLMQSYPIGERTITKDWKKFYKRYPQSAGIFSFGKVKYYPEDATAMVYYWVRRNGLSGHGAIATMVNAGGSWQVKYKTYLWWN